MKKHLFLFVAAAVLAGCGGADPGPLPQPLSPVFTDPGPLSVQEFTTVVAKLAVTSPDGNNVKLSLSGADAALFSITGDGTLRFAIPPDYLNPADSDKDNVYAVTVVADDTYSKPTAQTLSIKVAACPSCQVVNTSAHVMTDATTFVRENVIASFEYPAQMQQDAGKYTLTGAFASTTNWNNLEYTNTNLAPIAARVGGASVSTCEIGGAGCDAPTGTITINNVTIAKDSITFLMSGGNGGPDVGAQVLYTPPGSATPQVLGTYNPNSCGDPVLKGDQHYVNFDTSALIGEKVQLKIFDNATGGCGFVAFDHFYQTDLPRGTKAGVLAKPLEPVKVTLDGAVQVLVPFASFENPMDMVTKRGWVGTGVFANPGAVTSWQGTTGTDTNSARVGDRAISTCEIGGPGTPCDPPVGTLTSPPFKVTDNFFNFLMHGGGAGKNVGMRLLDTVGNVLLTYNPSSCGPSFVQNNDDWTRIDVSALRTATIKAQLFDEETTGCGFVSTDHWYQSATAWNPSGNGKDGGAVVLNNTNTTTLGFNVTVSADSFTQVIGDFDDPTATLANWTATGDFLNPANADAWKGVSGVARVGGRAVSTCEINGNNKGCDAPTGTLTSPLFTVNAARPFLNFLMSGGDASKTTVGLQVMDATGAVVATYSPSSCGQASIQGDGNWVTLDLSAKVGSQVKVQVFDNESGGCGFVSFDHLYMGEVRKK